MMEQQACQGEEACQAMEWTTSLQGEAELVTSSKLQDRVHTINVTLTTLLLVLGSLAVVPLLWNWSSTITTATTAAAAATTTAAATITTVIAKQQQQQGEPNGGDIPRSSTSSLPTLYELGTDDSESSSWGEESWSSLYEEPVPIQK
jgi:hypothetical protein